MSELSELYKAMSLVSQQRRASNRRHSAKMLLESGLECEVKNNGAHLVVDAGTFKVDFWPGTGKWISRAGKSGRGVKNLIRYIRGEKAPE